MGSDTLDEMPRVAFRDALAVWARVAVLSFGGPAGQIAVMHRILVEEKRWISEGRFLHALNYCMLLPGPEAHQLSVYIGWLLHGLRGGLAAGLLFMLPGVAAIMGLSVLYVLVGEAGPVSAVFFGLKAAVLAVVLQAVVRIGRRVLKGPLLVALAVAAFAAGALFGLPFPLIVAGAAVLGALAIRPVAADVPLTDRRRPPLHHTLLVLVVGVLAWGAPVLAAALVLGGDSVLTQIGTFFSQMAVVSFGGAYAVLSHVAQVAVEDFGWLSAGEMLDGLAMAETTPGPLILVVQFVAFLGAFHIGGGLDPMLAGMLGGLMAAWVTFVPSFLWIFLGAPYVEILRGNRVLSGALAGVTASVVGVILNLAFWFALRTLFTERSRVSAYGLDLDVPILASFDIVALGLSALALVLLFGMRLGMLTVLAICGLAGLGLHVLGVAGE